MTIETMPGVMTVEVPEGKRLSVKFAGVVGELEVNGRAYRVGEQGKLYRIFDDQDQKSVEKLVERVLKVGERLRDGTVVLAVHLVRNEALFVPAKIFRGKTTFDHQNDVVAWANDGALQGHQDWRRITDREGDILAANWFKVTDMKPEWFWLASALGHSYGYLACGGDKRHLSNQKSFSFPVPVIRSGPARILDI